MVNEEPFKEDGRRHPEAKIAGPFRPLEQRTAYQFYSFPTVDTSLPDYKNQYNDRKIALSPKRYNMFGFTIEQPKYATFKQQRGTMNNQEELQKAFIAFLVEDAAAQGIKLQSEQDLQAYAEQLGEEGIKAKYQEFIQRMQGGVKAQLGAKLNYIKKIKGTCQNDEELVYMKEGGRMCAKCIKKAQKGTEAPKGKKNAVQEFRERRVSENDTVHINKQPYDLTPDHRHKQFPKLTNSQYKNLPLSKKADIDVKDQTRKEACGGRMKKRK